MCCVCDCVGVCTCVRVGKECYLRYKLKGTTGKGEGEGERGKERGIEKGEERYIYTTGSVREGRKRETTKTRDQ